MSFTIKYVGSFLVDDCCLDDQIEKLHAQLKSLKVSPNSSSLVVSCVTTLLYGTVHKLVCSDLSLSSNSASRQTNRWENRLLPNRHSCLFWRGHIMKKICQMFLCVDPFKILQIWIIDVFVSTDDVQLDCIWFSCTVWMSSEKVMFSFLCRHAKGGWTYR